MLDPNEDDISTIDNWEPSSQISPESNSNKKNSYDLWLDYCENLPSILLIDLEIVFSFETFRICFSVINDFKERIPLLRIYCVKKYIQINKNKNQNE